MNSKADEVLRLASTILCLCLSMRLAYARALPRADSTTSTTAGGDSSTTTSTSTSSSSSPSSTGNGTPGGSINVEVWAPLVGIVAVIALMILYTCFRKNSMNASMISATTSANAAAASNTSGSSGTTTGARRRPRRTPSQISTRSLPAYMTDPGEQEIVLARGGIRRNRSRPNMGDESDDEYMGDDDDMDMDMDEQSRSLSQADRPLLSDSSIGVSDRRRLAPPERYSSRGTTSFETIRMGSEDSQHGLLRDEPEDMDGQEGAGTTYMFGEGTTGGQLYDDEEHVEMRELARGVSVGSASGSSAGSVSGRGGAPADALPPAHASSSSPRTMTLPPPPARSGFFSSISSILGNSLSSVAYSFSGMNTSMPGPITGGSSYNPLTDPSRATERASAPRESGTSSAVTRATTSRGTTTARQNTSGTMSSTGTSQLLAPPPPYEGNSNNSTSTAADSSGGQQQHGRSRSRSSPRPSISSTRPSFFRNRSPSGSNPSDSTLSLNNTSSPLSHARNPSGSASTTSLTISAPLAHTVTRSTFAYPASGPTTEQIKFLSSREALGRFGMPYGEEAVAAARAARSVTPTNQPPPPSFEDVAGNNSSGTTPEASSSTDPGPTSISSNPPSEPIQTASPTSIIESPSSSKSRASSSSNYYGHGPRRTDSVASKISVRSNRSMVGGPRGPRNSVRRSTLPVDRERGPRPSMDSVDSIDTIDSFGMDVESPPSNRNATDQEGVEDMAFWATAADQIGNSESSTTQPQPQVRRSTLQSLPKLIVDAQTQSTQSNNNAYSQRNQPIIPTTAPRGFVMSSPPASPTPTTSTNPHGGLNELGVPVITFAPATPSAESHGHGLG